jgi:lysophospholipase L1-like esterase
MERIAAQPANLILPASRILPASQITILPPGIGSGLTWDSNNWRWDSTDITWDRTQIPSDTVNIVFLGDSITASPLLLPTILGLVNTREKYNLQNSGTSGYGYENFDAAYLAANVRDKYSTTARRNQLVIWAGTNDLGHGADGPTTYARYQSVMATILAYGQNWQYVVVDMLPRTFGNPALQPAFDTGRTYWNTAIAADSLWTKFVKVSDIAAIQSPPNTYLPDGTHPSQVGYDVICPYFLPSLTFP